MQVCTSLHTDNHTSTPPLSFLQAGCPSCRPTNSVKALKALMYVCMYVFVCLQKITFNLYQFSVHVAYSRGSVLLWQRRDTLYTSGFGYCAWRQRQLLILAVWKSLLHFLFSLPRPATENTHTHLPATQPKASKHWRPATEKCSRKFKDRLVHCTLWYSSYSHV